MSVTRRMPVIFVSHGAPDALLKSPGVVRCWRDLARDLPRPQSILAISAHWETRRPVVSRAATPETIHDFSGFDPALYRMRYAAPGAPSLAERVAPLVGAELDSTRGLDHGAWIPLSAMYPEADIPVTQLSLAAGPPSAQLAFGAALASLRDDGVLILASGAITHNFGWIDWAASENAPPLPVALEFSDWVAGRLAAGDTATLCDYRAAPHGAAAHPTDEHFLPLFVAQGAGAGSPRLLRPPFNYRGLAMDAYIWD